MTSLRNALIAGLGLATLGWASVLPAAAQYYSGPGYDRPSERRYNDGYDRRGYGGNDDRRGWRDDRRDYGRDSARGDWRNDRRPGYDGGRRQQDPMAGMSLDDRKRAVKNERDAQKKIFKQQQLQRSLLGQ